MLRALLLLTDLVQGSLRGGPTQGATQQVALAPSTLTIEKPCPPGPKVVGGTAALQQPKQYIKYAVMGGAGNQRECIINSLMAAHLMGLGIVVPEIFLVYHAKQEVANKGECGNTRSCTYSAPFDKRANWGYSDLFDYDALVKATAALNVPLIQPSEIPKDAKVIKTKFAIANMLATPEYQQGPLQSQLLETKKANCPEGICANTVIFEQEKMCYDFLSTIGITPRCKAAFHEDLCHSATNAVVNSPKIKQVAQDIADKLKAQAAGKPVVWHAFHMREWTCKASPADLDTVGFGEYPGPGGNTLKWLYLISEGKLNPELLAKFKSFGYDRVFQKDDVRPSIVQDVPFEVLGQLDFEAGNMLAEVYFGDNGSSSDKVVFIDRDAKKKISKKMDKWRCGTN